jgi:O-antigen/teichoic acid export membrane protein
VSDPPPDGTGSRERARIARNVTSSYAVQGLLALSTLLLTPYLYRRLGSGGFGTWSVMFTVTTVFTLVETGVSSGVSKYVAEYRAQARDQDLRATIYGGAVLLAAFGILALLVSAAIAYFATGLAAGDEEGAFRTGMLVLGCAMAIRFPFDALGAALTGDQRFDLFNIAQAVMIMAFPVGAVIAVESGAGVLGVAIAYASALVLGALLFAVLLRRSDPLLMQRPDGDLRDGLGRLTGFSSFTLLAESMAFIGQRMDTVVIATIRSATAAAPYAAALKLQSGLQSFTLPFVVQLMPMTSDLWARGRRSEVVRRFTLATRVALQITLPVAAGLAFFATDVMDLWLGDSAPAVAARILVILAIVQMVVLTVSPAQMVLVGVGRVRAVGAFATLSGLSNLGLSIVLVSSYGAIGAALGTLFTTVALSPVLLPLACRAVKHSTLEFLRDGVGIALLSSLPGLAVMAVIRLSLPAGAGRLALGLIVGVAICAAIGASQVGLDRLRAGLRGLRRPGELVEAPTGHAPEELSRLDQPDQA